MIKNEPYMKFMVRECVTPSQSPSLCVTFFRARCSRFMFRGLASGTFESRISKNDPALMLWKRNGELNCLIRNEIAVPRSGREAKVTALFQRNMISQPRGPRFWRGSEAARPPSMFCRVVSEQALRCSRPPRCLAAYGFRCWTTKVRSHVREVRQNDLT